jgi:hypothetical protein
MRRARHARQQQTSWRAHKRRANSPRARARDARPAPPAAPGTSQRVRVRRRGVRPGGADGAPRNDAAETQTRR